MTSFQEPTQSKHHNQFGIFGGLEAHMEKRDLIPALHPLYRVGEKQPNQSQDHDDIKDPCPFSNFVVVETGKEKKDTPSYGKPLDLFFDNRSKKALFRTIRSISD